MHMEMRLCRVMIYFLKAEIFILHYKMKTKALLFQTLYSSCKKKIKNFDVM